MVAKRIIPCLDVQNGRTVKGIQFESLIDVGDPVLHAQHYSESGADELVFLDISATSQGRKTLLAVVKKVAASIRIPFTVGGGIASIEDVSKVLEAGADKVSVNSAAVRDPGLIDRLVSEFGSQCIVVALDSKQHEGRDWIYINGGRKKTNHRTTEWAQEMADRGAGELLITSMDRDGTGDGFSCSLLRSISERVRIPVIASGGAGIPKHFTEVFQESGVDAALVAGILHRGAYTINDIKNELRKNSIEVRL